MVYKDKEKRKEYGKQYYQRNKEKIKKQTKEYREKNREHYKQYDKKYYLKNKDKIRERDKRYYLKHKERIKKRSKKYRENNKDKVKKAKKRDYQKNKKRINKKYKEYYQQHKEKIKKQTKEYREKNKDKMMKKINEYDKRKRKEDKNYNIKKRLRYSLRDALKLYTETGKIMSSKKYGIDYKAIIEHLKPFPKDLKNYEIHHIKPLHTFNFVHTDGSTDLKEIKRAFMPQNHKWVTIEEHKKIHNTYISYGNP